MNILELPNEFKDFQRIWCLTFPPQCRKCFKPYANINLSNWWKICLSCKRIYTIIPIYCWKLPDWDINNCCKICHGRHKTFENLCRIYKTLDGRFVDICCKAAEWLKIQGIIHPNDSGVGDENLFNLAHNRIQVL